MSVAERDIVLPRVPDASVKTAAETVHRLPVYAACTLFALLVNYVLGKDMAWDTLNYQFYAGFSALNDRFAQDYFAAGPPSYFNPYIYVPFYALVRAGLSPLAISSVLAVLHSIILWLTFELSVCVCPSDDRRTRMTYGVCGIALACTNPILLQQFGSSFADITTAELVVAGWLLLARAVRDPHAAKIVGAGLLIGAACALKMTNALHAVSAGALLIMLPRTVYVRIQYLIGYVLTFGIGFVLVASPWSYRLEQMFGNPLFPLMNGVFQSPEFTTEPLRHFRFIPDSIFGFFSRPFALADPAPMIQEEMSAPDLRYAVLLMLAGLWILRSLRKQPTPSGSIAARIGDRAGERALAALGLGLALDWILWLSASGNGRYFISMATITAAIIVALLFRVFPQSTVRNYVLFSVLAAQILQLSIGADYRWNKSPWDRRWLNVEIPEELITEPSLFLTVGIESNSFIAPFLAPGSGLINFSGGYALGPEGAVGARIRTMMQRYAPNVRVLWRSDQPSGAVQPNASLANDALSRFGLRVDTANCATITVYGLPPESVYTYIRAEPIQPAAAAHRGSQNTSYLATCIVTPDYTDRSALLAREHAVDLILDRVEDACPQLFQPRRMHTEHHNGVWRRLYVNTDLVALVFQGSVKFSNPVRGMPMVDLGRESNWSEAPQRLACGRRDGHYFANLLKSDEH